MVNYQNTKIYKIESHLGSKIYIGSTTKEYLSQRMDYHRSGYKHWKNGNGGNMSSYQLFDDYGLENCNILLIESYPCNSKDERASREGYYIKTTLCVNKITPSRTKKEYGNLYFEKNKDKITEYRNNRKEELKIYCKKRYEAKKDEINVKQKAYREANKEKINAYQEAHKEEANARKRENRKLKKKVSI